MEVLCASDSTRDQLEGDDQPRRCWTNDEDDMMRCYLGGMKGRVPGNCWTTSAEKYPHVDIGTVELNTSRQFGIRRCRGAQREAWRKHHADRNGQRNRPIEAKYVQMSRMAMSKSEHCNPIARPVSAWCGR